MNIAFLVGEFPSLSETFILAQITGLIDRGHNVVIYAEQPAKTDKVHPDVEKYRLLDRTHYYPKLPANYLLRLLRGLWLFMLNCFRNPTVLIRSLNYFQFNQLAVSLRGLYLTIPFIQENLKYDIIHCHFGNIGVRGLFLKKIGAISGSLVTTFYGYDINVIPLNNKNVYQELFQEGDLFIGISSFIVNKAKDLGCPEEKILKLPLGVSCSNYRFRQRILGVNELIKIISVARLVEKKGLEYSIRAVAKIARSHPNLLYRIVGDGTLRESLHDLVVELEMEQTIHLLGWKTKDEVRELYDDSHLFVLSSVTAANGDKEGQGLVLQEAQAMGLPVLATLHNGFPDSVLDGKSAFLVPERDVDTLAEKLDFLVEHPAMWSEMSEAGRTFVEANFDVDKLNDRLVDIYSKFLFK